MGLLPAGEDVVPALSANSSGTGLEENKSLWVCKWKLDESNALCICTEYWIAFSVYIVVTSLVHWLSVIMLSVTLHKDWTIKDAYIEVTF